MTADWTTCRVVRDERGKLWFRDPSDAYWTAHADYVDTCWPTGELADDFGPFAPVLDAAGLPVVATVGDLTARHIGRRVRVGGTEGELEALGITQNAGMLVRLDCADLLPDLDAPCEVLP